MTEVKIDGWYNDDPAPEHEVVPLDEPSMEDYPCVAGDACIGDCDDDCLVEAYVPEDLL